LTSAISLYTQELCNRRDSHGTVDAASAYRQNQGLVIGEYVRSVNWPICEQATDRNYRQVGCADRPIVQQPINVQPRHHHISSPVARRIQRRNRRRSGRHHSLARTINSVHVHDGVEIAGVRGCWYWLCVIDRVSDRNMEDPVVVILGESLRGSPDNYQRA
jgi:hypothetical protein